MSDCLNSFTSFYLLSHSFYAQTPAAHPVYGSRSHSLFRALAAVNQEMVRVETIDCTTLSDTKIRELHTFCNALMAETIDSFRLSVTQCELAYVFWDKIQSNPASGDAKTSPPESIVGVSFWRSKVTADPSHVAILQGTYYR